MMRNLAILVCAAIAAISTPTLGAIVYSGSQNVTLALSPMSPMDSGTIQIGMMAGDWDDFRVELWLDMGDMSMPGMTMGMGMGTFLGIFAPMSMAGSMGMNLGMGVGMGMGGVLGMGMFSPNLMMGAMIGSEAMFLDSAYLCTSGQFGEDGGYIGLRTAMGQYGWLHLLSQSGIGTSSHRVVFDSWAYESQPGLPISAGEGGESDWVPGKPHKMHWPQLPDLGATGMDVDASQGTLADDFKCTATGPIDDIYIWGSFRDDALPKDGPDSLAFRLSIYSDIPAAKDAPSRPGKVVWSKSFAAGEYTARKIYDGPEAWYDPVTNQLQSANHKQAYQYNFHIDKDPFTQQEGTIYWLVVRCTSPSGSVFGWKTTSLRYRWNDDAVFMRSGSSAWPELTYPKQHRYEGQSLDLAFVIAGDDKSKPEYDLGDAPDSSNSVAGATMLAYPSGVNAYFPTVYQAGSPPYGPIHHKPRDMFYLGKAVSLEREADIGTDEDTVNNIDPLNDAANQDAADDGLLLPIVMPSCQTITVKYAVTVTDPAAKRAYVNLWFDWNRDGDWDDVLTCPSGDQAPEWAVQNQTPALPGPGTFTIESPAFRCWHPTGRDLDPLWVRLTISEQPYAPPATLATPTPGFGGSGPAAGYEYGETEDYYIRPVIEAFPLKFDWGDAPDGAAAPGYPTLAAHDGARHVPVGPWLGDAQNMPDTEPDGQPQADALGDDLAGSPDEQGVVIPSPLIAGRLASATIEVNGGGGVVQAWIDFDGDHAWEAGEEIFNGFLPDGIHILSFVVPDNAAIGKTFARFRISTQGGLEPTGAAPDGEVEDHVLQIDKTPDGKVWCQLPDLTPRGIDICVDNGDDRSRTLADDFQCTSPGRLTQIRLWGSWKNDAKGEIKQIRVQIHPDDPVGSEGADKKNEYSKPGPEVLWEKSFTSGQFTETLHHVMKIGYEGWWDPATGELKPEGDKQVWRIDMTVDPKVAFLQEGSVDKPRIYWLSVRIETAGGRFGWKTRQWPEHFMDDAVWRSSTAGVLTAWDEMRYPTGHPFADIKRNSIDLAFCLHFTVEGTPVATSQPGTATQCPVAQTSCPAVLTTCPVAATCCPTGATKCPAVATQCPVAQTQCPAVSTQCPAVQTECPQTTTACWTVVTECPAFETRCPATATQCPAVTTQCPVTVTACKPVVTECPATDTRCPATDTKCPAAQTRCPVIKTQCPICTDRTAGRVLSGTPSSEVCPVVDTRPATFRDYMALAGTLR
jgi:hypothetical protein